MMSDGALNWAHRGMLLGPGIIKHEPLTGWDGHPGIQVRNCVICGRFGWRGPKTSFPLGVRIKEQLVRPGWTDEYRDADDRVVFTESETAAVVGWVTTCKHVVWAGEWEMVIPGPGRVPRWEDRRIPEKERDAARYAAFDRGEE